MTWRRSSASQGLLPYVKTPGFREPWRKKTHLFSHCLKSLLVGVIPCASVLSFPQLRTLPVLWLAVVVGGASWFLSALEYIYVYLVQLLIYASIVSATSLSFTTSLCIYICRNSDFWRSLQVAWLWGLCRSFFQNQTGVSFLRAVLHQPSSSGLEVLVRPCVSRTVLASWELLLSLGLAQLGINWAWCHLS